MFGILLASFAAGCSANSSTSVSSSHSFEESGGCKEAVTSELPAWAADFADLPGRKIISSNQDVIGIIFANTLCAPAKAGDPSNKILWVVRLPRDDQPLIVKGRLSGSSEVATITEDGGSGPGEIYPTEMSVPLPGCWHMTLTWNGNADTIDLEYQ